MLVIDLLEMGNAFSYQTINFWTHNPVLGRRSVTKQPWTNFRKTQFPSCLETVWDLPGASAGPFTYFPTVFWPVPTFLERVRVKTPSRGHKRFLPSKIMKKTQPSKNVVWEWTWSRLKTNRDASRGPSLTPRRFSAPFLVFLALVRLKLGREVTSSAPLLPTFLNFEK